MTIPSIVRAPLCLMVLLLPEVAHAHPGHEIAAQPLLSGMLHPLTGADHLAAMVMVGLWGGMLAGRARWGVPAAFMAAMVVGFGTALAGATPFQPIAVAEWGIVLSVLVLGVALTLRMRTSLVAACVLSGGFGFAHGMAHGLEAPGHGMASFAVGFVVATAALHVLGVEIARRVPGAWMRSLGVVGTGLGVMLVVS